MASLQMIKEDYAKTVECENWAKFVLNAENSELLMALNIISERYAQQRVNKVLEKAAETIFNTPIDKGKPDCYLGGYGDALNDTQNIILKLKNK